MTKLDIQKEAKAILHEILKDEKFGRFVDDSLPIPRIFQGSSHIKPIVLGQDPTVKNHKSRQLIDTVLNLNKKNGSLTRYLSQICDKLDLSINHNVYATNYLKNFFTGPPTTITEIDVFSAFQTYWLPLLLEEIISVPQCACYHSRRTASQRGCAKWHSN